MAKFLFFNTFVLNTYITCRFLFQECQERTKTQNCPATKDRNTCLIATDGTNQQCGWCGDKCGNQNVCEPVVWLNMKGFTEFEGCLNVGETTTTISTTGKLV